MARYGLRPGLVIAGALVAVLLGILAGWAWDYLLPPPREQRASPAAPPAPAPPGRPAAAPPSKTPVYEEPVAHLPPSGVLQKIDEALFTALRQHGVSNREMVVTVVNSPQSELTRVEVHLPPGQAPELVARNLSAKLTGLAQTRRSPLPGGLRLAVLLASCPTHQVDLYPYRLRPPPRQLPARPQVALIVDDLGYLMAPARQLAALELPITFSILPYSPFGRQIAKLAAQKGLEVMVHLPMEPITYPRLKPGPGALLTTMAPRRIASQTERDLACVPSARGANNHMGSRFTQKPAKLKPVMQVLKRKGLFFVDSVTSPRSRAMQVARGQGVPTGRRHVFLDHDPTRPAIEAQIKRMLRLAHQKGRVIAIAHPHRTTLSVLKQYAQRLRREVELVPVSVILGVKAARSHRPAAALDMGKAKP